MLQPTPMITYAFIFLATLLAPILAYIVACYSKEELLVVYPYVKRLYWTLMLILMTSFTILTTTKLLALLIIATGVIFIVTSKQKEKTLLPLLALILYSSLQNKTLLVTSSTIIFLLLMFHTTLYVTSFVKKDNFTIKKTTMWCKILLEHTSYIIVSVIVISLNV